MAPPLPFAVTDAAVAPALGPIQLVFVMLAFAVVLTYLARRLGIADPILLHEEYEHEAGHVLPRPGAGPDESEQELLDHRAIRNAVLTAQREAVIGLRDAGVINDETLRSIERGLDLEAIRAGA